MKLIIVIVSISVFICTLTACEDSSVYTKDQGKLIELLQKSDLDNYSVMIVIPLENACSPCSMMTLHEIDKLEEQFKTSVKLVLTGKSFRIIDQTLESLDLTGFSIHKDGGYLFWKNRMVGNSPEYFFIKKGEIIERGTIVAPEVMVFMNKLNEHLNI